MLTGTNRESIFFYLIFLVSISGVSFFACQSWLKCLQRLEQNEPAPLDDDMKNLAYLAKHGTYIEQQGSARLIERKLLSSDEFRIHLIQSLSSSSYELRIAAINAISYFIKVINSTSFTSYFCQQPLLAGLVYALLLTLPKFASDSDEAQEVSNIRSLGLDPDSDSPSTSSDRIKQKDQRQTNSTLLSPQDCYTRHRLTFIIAYILKHCSSSTSSLKDSANISLAIDAGLFEYFFAYISISRAHPNDLPPLHNLNPNITSHSTQSDYDLFLLMQDLYRSHPMVRSLIDSSPLLKREWEPAITS
ncbi:uncharacterized protein V1516DRAFT_669507 [Lipomyces oligophaga]|uniref:uncharacterized protein n=1 Tax=Lipomyces oligophaga TaxID=45792 RepID=UPI0034CFBE31